MRRGDKDLRGRGEGEEGEFGSGWWEREREREGLSDERINIVYKTEADTTPARPPEMKRAPTAQESHQLYRV